MGMVELENITGNTQTVYTEDGARHAIPPYTTRMYRDNIAEIFNRDRASFVRVAGQTDTPPLLPGEKQVWIANMTGSPFVPTVYKNKVVRREKTPTGVVTQEVEEVVPNPVAVATTLKWEMQVGQGKDPYGRIQGVSPSDDFNLQPVRIVLRPRQRACFGRDVGSWLMQRDAVEGAYGVGKIIECRAPTSFEPTPQWAFPEILFFAKMVDEPGFTANDITTLLRDSDPNRNRKTVLKLEELVSDPEAEEAAKDSLLARLFYRLVNPKFSLPNEVAFKRNYEEFRKKTATLR